MGNDRRAPRDHKIRRSFGPSSRVFQPCSHALIDHRHE